MTAMIQTGMRAGDYNLVLAIAEASRSRSPRRRWRRWQASRWLREIVLGVLLGLYLGAIVFVGGALIEVIQSLWK